MARVLITGAAGFLGTELTRTFVREGHEVRVGDLQGSDLRVHTDLGAQPFVCDVTDGAAVRAALEGVELCIHAAGIFDLAAPKEALWKVNAEGARVTCEAAAEAGVSRFVLISSTSVYGQGSLDCREDREKKPTHPYAASKWSGEQEVVRIGLQTKLPVSVLRPTLIYGPGSRYGLAVWVAILALRAIRDAGRLPIAHGGPLGHLIHVEDVARAAALVATHPDAVGHVYNVADDAPIAAGALVRMVAGCVGAEVGDSPLPWWAMKAFRAGKPMLSRLVQGQNEKLAYLWEELVRQEGLEAALSPRIDMDWVDFLSTDNTYETDRIKGLGFACARPDAREAFPQTVDWYRAQRWIPAAAAP